MTNQTSKKFKKAAILVGAFLLISLVYPLFKVPGANDTSTANAEIRFSKGAKVMNPALGHDFITWIEYHAGAYNLYLYNFSTREERQLNTVPLSVETVGPVVYQNHVYWVDHPAEGWVFTDYNIEYKSVGKLATFANRVYTLAVYENFLAFQARSGSGTDIFLLNKNSAKIEAQNITNDEIYQTEPSIFGQYLVWSEFPVTCDNSAAPATSCQPAAIGNIIKYDLLSGQKVVLKENLAKLSNVKIQNLAVAWSQTENGRQVVKVDYLNTGTEVTVSPENFNSYNPVMSSDLIIYFVNRSKGADLDYYQFTAHQAGTLGNAQAEKKQITISPDSQKVAWIDNRLGQDDIFYVDFKTDAKDLDQDIDGVSDSIEIQKGTNPYDPDTDHDGLTDFEEIYRYKTQATMYDSDGDGLTDGEEIKNWSTNPLAFDSDYDSFDDKTEIINGYDPNQPASHASIVRSDPFKPQAFFYNKPRVFNLTIEQQMALELRQNLDMKLGVHRWGAKGAQDWFKMVNAYVYGEYNTNELAQYVKGDKYALSETMLASEWRLQKPYAVKTGKLHAVMK